MEHDFAIQAIHFQVPFQLGQRHEVNINMVSSAFGMGCVLSSAPRK